MKICSIEGCERKHYGKGYCSMHWKRARKGKNMFAPAKGSIKVCKHENCGRRHKAFGFCEMHHERIKKGRNLDSSKNSRLDIRPRCRVEDCFELCVGMGLCNDHYAAARRVKKALQAFLGLDNCLFHNCYLPVYAKNVCEKHYRKNKMYSAKRRAVERNAQTFQISNRDAKWLKTANCFYCGEYAEHVDHVIPLSRGGSHGIGNMVPACMQCNLKKNAKFIIEWKDSLNKKEAFINSRKNIFN